mmetsp:Transcript_17861/g.46025  ORF Transcript_17861/g.46025 Transcript_17861/m.46025 type:complete len:211 (+) Transcript_17861:961-1593(+)
MVDARLRLRRGHRLLGVGAAHARRERCEAARLDDRSRANVRERAGLRRVHGPALPTARLRFGRVHTARRRRAHLLDGIPGQRCLYRPRPQELHAGDQVHGRQLHLHRRGLAKHLRQASRPSHRPAGPRRLRPRGVCRLPARHFGARVRDMRKCQAQHPRRPRCSTYQPAARPERPRAPAELIGSGTMLHRRLPLVPHHNVKSSDLLGLAS